MKCFIDNKDIPLFSLMRNNCRNHLKNIVVCLLFSVYRNGWTNLARAAMCIVLNRKYCSEILLLTSEGTRQTFYAQIQTKFDRADKPWPHPTIADPWTLFSCTFESIKCNNRAFTRLVRVYKIRRVHTPLKERYHKFF